MAGRYGVSLDAALTLLDALGQGNGAQAQFNHPDTGGMGQWSQGGMIMIRRRVQPRSQTPRLRALQRAGRALARAAAGAIAIAERGRRGEPVRRRGGRIEPMVARRIGQPGVDGRAKRYCATPISPAFAGSPSSRAGAFSVYDSGEHMVSQVLSGAGRRPDADFTSQLGVVRVADLPFCGGARGTDRPGAGGTSRPRKSRLPSRGRRFSRRSNAFPTCINILQRRNSRRSDAPLQAPLRRGAVEHAQCSPS